ncbi:MAG: HAD family hydrolase [Actinomycetota bacterium]
MSLIPLSDRAACAKGNISLIAADMDGTLTRQGKFTAPLFEALEQLADAKIAVVIVTGRSAGWVQGLKAYLPVTAAIAENGGLFYWAECEEPEILTTLGNLTEHRQQLAQTFEYLKAQFPQITESADNRFRLTDWTFSVAGLTGSELAVLAQLCRTQGWSFTYSTVQCHIKPIQQNKASSLRQVLSRHFPQLAPEQIITIGDSPNDESLFDPIYFPYSVGVANLLDYADQMQYLPTYVTTQEEGEGFCELAQLLVECSRA